MTTFLYLYLFALGLVLGSFFNVVGIRVADGESIVTPRSHCPTCERTLNWYELIPVLSYILQGGKCRGCRISISIKYPFFELLTAVLFVFSFYIIGFGKDLILALCLVSLLVIISISDFHRMLIPNKILLFFFLLFIPIQFIVPHQPWWDGIVGFFVGGILLFLIALASRGGMGGGDIKLFALLGFILGIKGVLLAFFFSTLFGAVFGSMLMLVGKVKRGKPMPFGPYIALGTLTAYYYGEQLWNWYIQLI
ncbi:prepilin peptidase [Anaerobacillus sp. MEB173]|uniref:prepilin peptidase n=1 Tax=Anaerobacillus sp. MEB173 TaxID=3383345 RepID=UPI003F8F768A